MKSAFLFLLFFCSFFCQFAIASEIRGQLPNYPNTTVNLYRFENYFNYNLIKIAKTTTDSFGNFVISGVDLKDFQFYELVVADKQIPFFGENGFNYTVSAFGKGVRIKEGEPGINDLLSQMNSDFSALRLQFVDSVTGGFLQVKDPLTILEGYNSIQKKYTEAGVNLKYGHQKRESSRQKADYFERKFKNFIEYHCARQKLFFTVFSYGGLDSTGAVTALNEIERKYILEKEVAMADYGYISLLESIIQARMIYSNFIVYTDIDNVFDAGMKLAGNYKNDTVNALAALLVIDMVYKNKWYVPEYTLPQFNSKVDSIMSTFKIPLLKAYLEKLVIDRNSVKPGDPFPIIQLPDIEKKTIDLTTIKEPFILVDFWTTWCSGCKQDMVKFPAIMEKYKGKLMIVSISADNDFGTMKAYLDKMSYSGKWAMLYNGQTGKYLDELKITGYPTYFILNKDRKIIAMPRDIESALEKQMK